MDNFQKIWRETMAAIAELYRDFSLPAVACARRLNRGGETVVMPTGIGPMEMGLIDALMISPVHRLVFKVGIWASFPGACLGMITHAIALSFQELRKKNG